MKLILTIASFVLSTTCLKAQLQLEDSIRLKMQQATGDSMLYALSHQAYSHFEELNNDSAYKYVSQCISLAERNDKELALAIALARRGYQQTSLAKFSEAFADLVRGISIAGDPVNVDIGWIPNITGTPETERIRVLAICHHMYALLMGRTGNVQDQNRHFHIARDYATRISNAGRIFLANMNFARIFSDLNNIDSARYYIDEALNILQSTDSSFQYSDKKYLGHIYATLGDIYQKSGDEVNARNSYYQGLKTSADQGNISAQVRAAYRLTQYYLHRKQPDSALFYAKLAKDLIGKLGLVIGTEINPGNIYEHVYRSYQIQNNPDSTLLYANLTLKLKDSLYRLYIAGMTQVQVLGFKEQQRLQELENEKQLYRSRVRLYTLLGGLAIFLIIAMILYRNNRQKNKSNKVLAKTLADLKSTQAQLVHSEKMASLGELTAGIAHEIQNPLNFVNNFSEVSNELADEMIEALNQNKGEEAIAIATDIKQNLEKSGSPRKTCRWYCERYAPA